MKEFANQINVMINRSVRLVPSKGNPNYTRAVIVTSGSLVGLSQTAQIYRDTGKLTEAEYDSLLKKINKKISNF